MIGQGVVAINLGQVTHCSDDVLGVGWMAAITDCRVGWVRVRYLHVSRNAMHDDLPTSVLVDP
jgi:hypothetical protein